MNLYHLSEMDLFSEHSSMMQAHVSVVHHPRIAQKDPTSLDGMFENPLLFENRIQSQILEGNYAECRNLIKQIPSKQFKNTPVLMIYDAIINSFGNFSSAEINRLLSHTEELDSDQKLTGEVTAVRALVQSYLGNQEQAIQLSHKALNKIAPENTFFRQLIERNLGIAYAIRGQLRESAKWHENLLLSSYKLQDDHGILAAYNHLTYIRKVQGRLKEAEVIYKKAMAYIQDYGLEEYPHSIKIMAGYGHLLMQWHEIEQAKIYLRKAIQLAKLTDILLAQKAYRDLSEVFIREHDLRSALVNIQEFRQILQRNNSSYYQLINHLLRATEARIHLEAGRIDQANTWLISSGFEKFTAQELYSKFGDQLGYLLPIAVRIFLEKHQPERALKILKATLPKYLHAGANTYLIRGLNAQALTYQAIGENPKAIKSLLKAVDLAEPEGNLGDFIFVGQNLMPLLYEIKQSGIETEFCSNLLTIFSNFSKRRLASETLMHTIDPLSNRELDVLQLIAKGMTNREIAGKLYLSANTIKSHSIKIYRKLNVNNRSQAVSKARMLGILPSKLSAPFHAST